MIFKKKEERNYEWIKLWIQQILSLCSTYVNSEILRNSKYITLMVILNFLTLAYYYE